MRNPKLDSFISLSLSGWEIHQFNFYYFFSLDQATIRNWYKIYTLVGNGFFSRLFFLFLVLSLSLSLSVVAFFLLQSFSKLECSRNIWKKQEVFGEKRCCLSLVSKFNHYFLEWTAVEIITFFPFLLSFLFPLHSLLEEHSLKNTVTSLEVI